MKYDPNHPREKYLDKPSILWRVCNHVRYNPIYKIIAETIAFIALMAVIYAWYVIACAYHDML